MEIVRWRYLFADDLVAHLAPTQAGWLEANGVLLGEMLAAQLDKVLLVRKKEILL